MIVLAVVAAAAAAPQDQPLVKILSQSFDQDDQGSYQYAYELDNGQKVSWFFTLLVTSHYLTHLTRTKLGKTVGLFS